jgi:hypothetical protein
MTTEPPQHAERQTPRSGARSIVAYTVAGLALAAVLVVGYAVTRPSGTTPTTPVAAASAAANSNDTYGTLPSWLPKATVRTGRVAASSASQPWVALEGDVVVVHIGRAHASTSIVGPRVPHEGQFPLPKTTPASFTMSLTDASGPMIVNTRRLVIFDERGLRHWPVVAGPTVRVVRPGHPITMQLHAVIPSGPGEIVWMTATGSPIVSYEFVTEID